ncbi:MAG: hypothetical protein QY310_01475 [Candidatus Jettenia sp. CY-1]|nr:MAG: hypothetical protein QY310_01475 [Candidatus Jettenia sp. CY-1]
MIINPIDETGIYQRVPEHNVETQDFASLPLLNVSIQSWKIEPAVLS